eukprot:SAG25_NODE_5809_length_619_cov_0.955769_1_plen_34_part_01
MLLTALLQEQCYHIKPLLMIIINLSRPAADMHLA